MGKEQWDEGSLYLFIQVAQVREHAERRIAQLNSRIQGLESRLHQLSQENRALSAGATAARGAGTQVRRRT